MPEYFHAAYFFGGKINTAISANKPKYTFLLVTSVHCKGYATNSIRTFVLAIAYYHKLFNYSDPSSTFMIQKAFQGLKKLKPSMDNRQPITPAIINQLVHQLRQLDITSYDKTLFTTMFLVAFYGLCRVSEITHSKHNNHNIQVENVSLRNKPSSIVITFQSF